MRALGLGSMLTLAFFLFCPGLAAQCERIDSGEEFWVRLIDPVSSYSSKRGTPIRAILVQSPECNGQPVFPMGTMVRGKIKSVKKVGMGLIHEAASIELAFDRFVAESGESFKFSASVLEVANARESVRKGMIRGIRATDTPQGRVTSRLKHLPTWNPYSDWFLIGYRTAFPVFPEPEIYLPRGTDVRLVLTSALSMALPAAPSPVFQPFEETERSDVVSVLAELPQRTTTRYGEDADIVNMVFLGTREQFEGAFTQSGWVNSDPTSHRSVAHEFHAFLAFQNYPTAPVSTQLLEGEPASMIWQKSLNSYAKREHLRVWSHPEMWHGEPVWTGAYLRETGATLSFRMHKFVHHVDPGLDEGREMVIRDLAMAGCVEAVDFVPRPAMAGSFTNATQEELKTDGSLAIVRLKNCEQPIFEYSADAAETPIRPRSKVKRYIRMMLLTYRSDVVRGNIVYGLFDLTRMGIEKLRRDRARKETASLAPAILTAGAPQKPGSPPDSLPED